MSPHFTLTELGGKEIADILYELQALQKLLEECRSLWGDRPIHITSGYRDRAENERIGGSPTSQHCRGQAADLHVEGLTAAEAWRLLRESSISVGQAIIYGLAGDMSGPGSFLHVSLPTDSIHDDFRWTTAPGGSGGPYYRVPRRP